MKTRTPIKRNKALVSFSRDHHFGLLLVWKIRHGLLESVNPGRISNYVLYFFREDLAGHFRDEENLLFSQLPSDDSYRKRAEAEHAIINKLVQDIGKDKQNIALLRQLADELEKHIRFEERELFNHLDPIPAEKQAGIAGRLSNDSRSLDDNWEDKFWE
jgi:iron-sulfur cluster repair protein YtfE (RIC family)